jgi:hypothetical protein
MHTHVGRDDEPEDALGSIIKMYQIFTVVQTLK